MSDPRASVMVRAALDFAKRKWAVLPLYGIRDGVCTCGRPGCGKPGKHPCIKSGTGHSKATTDPDQICSWWDRWPDANVGIATGAVSGLLVLDVDTHRGGDESLKVLLNGHPTNTPTAQTGGGGRHLYFAYPGRKTRNAVGFRPGLDIRGDAGIVVAPPSLHHSGRRYTWTSDPDLVALASAPLWLMESLTQTVPAVRVPVSIPADFESVLCGACDRVRQATDGTRNDTLNREAFSLGRRFGPGKLDSERVHRELLEAARACGLPELEAERTIASGLEGGMREIRETASADGADAVRTIVVHKRIAAVADEAEAALLPHPHIYVRGASLVSVVYPGTNECKWLDREAGSPTIIPISPAHMRELLDRAAVWVNVNGDPIFVPSWVAETLLARPRWRFPALTGVVETPTLRPDGSVIDRPGYDPTTGLLYRPRHDFPPAPKSPERGDAGHAAVALLEPLHNFPFEGEQARSATLAAILSIAGRYAIQGPVPMFPVRSPTGGTGKGLLVDAASLIATGRTPARTSMGRDDDEIRKRILAIGISGAPIVLIDNEDRCLGSESLAAALTSDFFEDRLLGKSRVIRVPMTQVWFATGNGLTFRATLGRRVVPIDLNAQMEFPEDRTGFRYPDLRGHLRALHPRLLVAALTILLAYDRAGRPGHGKVPMGSFEAWDAFIRGACVWLDLEDPCLGRNRIRDEGDNDLELVRALFRVLFESFGPTAKTVVEIRAAAEESPDLRAALAALDSRASGSGLNSRLIGDRLRQWRGKVAGGYRLVAAPKKVHGATAWRILPVGESGESGESVPPRLGNQPDEMGER